MCGHVQFKVSAFSRSTSTIERFTGACSSKYVNSFENCPDNCIVIYAVNIPSIKASRLPCSSAG